MLLRRRAAALASLARSIELVAAHLAAREDSPRVHAALATYWQRLAYELYPDAPAASRHAAARARALGGSRLAPPMGGRLRALSRLVGWRLAYRLGRLLSR